jgi:hypothetical protein
MDEPAVNGDLPQATECAFLDCQLEEDALYTNAVTSAPGNIQALALVRAAVEQLKAKLKEDLLAEPSPMHLKKNSIRYAGEPHTSVRCCAQRPMSAGSDADVLLWNKSPPERC